MFNVDYNAYADNLNVPDKRLPKFTALLQALSAPLQYNANIMVQFENGSAYDRYMPAVPYSTGDRVIYLFGVYESGANNNTGNTPSLNAGKWTLINQYFIGADERIRLRGDQKLAFEYALNRWFGTVFRQPALGNSDIYITNYISPIGSFISGASEADSYAVYTTNSGIGYVYMAYNIANASNYNFVIHVPATFLSALPGGAQTIRNIADKYAIAGTTYSIVTY